MSLSLEPILARSGASHPRENFTRLAQAVAMGDLRGARAAYAEALKSAPAALSSGSGFRDLGRALHSGDASGAREALDRLDRRVSFTPVAELLAQKAQAPKAQESLAALGTGLSESDAAKSALYIGALRGHEPGERLDLLA